MPGPVRAICLLIFLKMLLSKLSAEFQIAFFFQLVTLAKKLGDFTANFS
jgi:hypothetical protein